LGSSACPRDAEFAQENRRFSIRAGMDEYLIGTESWPEDEAACSVAGGRDICHWELNASVTTPDFYVDVNRG